jgi:ATP-dependent Clp protease ATP-binding subunit ClpA
LEIILKNCDKNLLDFIKETSYLMKKENFDSKEFLTLMINKNEILEIFNFLEIVPIYKKNNEDSKEKLSYKKILSDSFKLAYNNNLSKVTLKEVLLTISKYQNALKFLNEFNIKYEDLIDVVSYFYKKKIAIKKLEKNKRESLLRIDSNMNRGMTGKLTPMVENLTYDLTKNINKLSEKNFIGREEELNSLINILNENNSPLIIGDPGVGKTSLIEYLALKMGMSDVPRFLQDRRLVLLNTSALISSDNKDSSLTNKLLKIINEINSAKHIILAIDEISNLIGIKDLNNENNFDLFSQLCEFINKKRFSNYC